MATPFLVAARDSQEPASAQQASLGSQTQANAKIQINEGNQKEKQKTLRQCARMPALACFVQLPVDSFGPCTVLVWSRPYL